ncbi:tail fiber domain-containing protein [Miltoncostaea oceani]|uniref:tail fiber domain-containing protein n=1 Tax=Miltoncostaea oceani TaxID=2843216 RepID=UPI001C3D9775|nr:tail fiber domain-containing protein [Miltoncostaea oceani]
MSADEPEQAGPSPSQAMARLRRIRGVSWEWKDPSHPSHRPGRQMGVIAQEVQEVFPDLVREGADGYLTVDYAGLLAPVIEAIKELDLRLERIERHIGLPHEAPSDDPGVQPEEMR